MPNSRQDRGAPENDTIIQAPTHPQASLRSEEKAELKTRTPRFLAALATSLLVSLTAGPQARAALELGCQEVPQLLSQYLQKHVLFHYLNDELRTRALDSYVKRLDPSKTMYLEAEAEALVASLRSVFHDIKTGDCHALLEIHQDLVKRYKLMEDQVRKIVGKEDYAVDASVMLVLDPDRRSRPKTPEERNAFLEKLVHFQMSNYLTNDLELDAAREKLIHRYELATRRASERKDGDVYAGFLDAFASAMDPHSNYFTAEAVEDFKIGMELSLDGIGVALSSRDGYSVVEKIIPGGAADKLDILEPEDKIIGVAQEGDPDVVDVIDMDLRDVVRLIRGKRGTKVHLSVLRQDDETKKFTVTIVRDKINLEEQAASLSFETIEVPGEDGAEPQTLKLAVLELPSFYGGRKPSDRQSTRDLRNLLKQVKDEKADGLLLDLSRNGGGLLDNSIEIAGFFIDDGGVVAVKNTFEKLQVLEDPDQGILYEGPMVIYTSRVSASASEIVAGAMKDYRRAVLVGDDHTFGKGTVQSMHPLADGLGALKVTTAMFFRPGGASTQHAGVEADIVLPSVLGARDIGERTQDYSLPGQHIKAFDGAERGDASHDWSWRPVSQELVTELARRSAERVSASEEFAEIIRNAEKAENSNGVIHLNEILEEKSKRDAAEGADDEAGADDGAAETDEPSAETTPGSPDSVLPEGDSPKPNGGEVMSEPPSDLAKNDDEPSAQQREALRILADQVLIERNL